MRDGAYGAPIGFAGCLICCWGDAARIRIGAMLAYATERIISSPLIWLPRLRRKQPRGEDYGAVRDRLRGACV